MRTTPSGRAAYLPSSFVMSPYRSSPLALYMTSVGIVRVYEMGRRPWGTSGVATVWPSLRAAAIRLVIVPPNPPEWRSTMSGGAGDMVAEELVKLRGECGGSDRRWAVVCYGGSSTGYGAAAVGGLVIERGAGLGVRGSPNWGCGSGELRAQLRADPISSGRDR